jgi:hypothetical protein
MTDPTPNFRAELERLLDLYEALGGNWTPHNYTDTWNDALASTRAALATPPPEPPTVMEILELSDEIEDAGLGQIDFVRAALERWGYA